MKKPILLISTLVSTILLNSSEITIKEPLNLDLESKYKYDENMKYEQPVKEYDEEKEEKKKSGVDIGVDVDVNKEEKSIDKLKLDMGTNF